MKNVLHVLFIFCVLMGQFCCAMVRDILINNRSSKDYLLRCEKEWGDLPSNQFRLVQLAWFFSENKARGEANIEFYDTNDEWHTACKKQGLCSFILYSHIKAIGNKKAYGAKLECKRPNVSIVKDFPEVDLCGRPGCKLTITDDLEKAELQLID